MRSPNQKPVPHKTGFYAVSPAESRYTFLMQQTEVNPGILCKQETELEPLCRVIIHNDDVTPMDFVVYVLERIFFVDAARAIDIMYTAHLSGLAYVQTLPKTQAQNRIGKV